jgi:hypothetical protein
MELNNCYLQMLGLERNLGAHSSVRLASKITTAIPIAEVHIEL